MSRPYPPLTSSQRKLLKTLVDARKRQRIARAQGDVITLAQAMDYRFKTPRKER